MCFFRLYWYLVGAFVEMDKKDDCACCDKVCVHKKGAEAPILWFEIDLKRSFDFFSQCFNFVLVTHF